MLCVVLFACFRAGAQQYLKSNEKPVLSFRTANGKRMMLAMDTGNKYLVYRFGTLKHIELEYPANLDNSFKKFQLFHYSRGGGAQNDAEEIMELRFNINGIAYRVYDDWRAIGNQRSSGIIIPETKTMHAMEIRALQKTKKGDLASLMDNDIPAADPGDD